MSGQILNQSETADTLANIAAITALVDGDMPTSIKYADVDKLRELRSQLIAWISRGTS